jgi:hypothetical protein
LDLAILPQGDDPGFNTSLSLAIHFSCPVASPIGMDDGTMSFGGFEFSTRKKETPVPRGMNPLALNSWDDAGLRDTNA